MECDICGFIYVDELVECGCGLLLCPNCHENHNCMLDDEEFDDDYTNPT